MLLITLCSLSPRDDYVKYYAPISSHRHTVYEMARRYFCRARCRFSLFFLFIRCLQMLTPRHVTLLYASADTPLMPLMPAPAIRHIAMLFRYAMP